MAVELSEKALAGLKKIGITTEMLTELNEGKSTKFDEAIKARDNKVVETQKEAIRNEVESELSETHKTELEAATKNAQIGAYNAASNQLLTLAKAAGVAVTKQDLADLDYKGAVAFVSKKLSEKIAQGSESDGKQTEQQKAELEQLSKQLDEANKIIAEKDALIQKHPQELEAATKNVLTNMKLETARAQFLEANKGKLKPAFIEEEFGKKALNKLLDEYIAQKAIKFELTTTADGKESFVPKVPQTKNGEVMKDKNGNPIFVPFQKDTTTTHTFETVLNSFFEDNKLIVVTGEGNGATSAPNTQQQQPQYNQNSKMPSWLQSANPYEQKEYL